jgi:hypothetical protein
MTLLTSVAGTFRAHVLVARLESEGIDAQLRGATSSAYGVTVGDLARVDVYVREEHLDDARLVLLSDEVDAAFDAIPDADPGDAPHARRLGWPGWVALALLAVALAGPLFGWLLDR